MCGLVGRGPEAGEHDNGQKSPKKMNPTCVRFRIYSSNDRIRDSEGYECQRTRQKVRHEPATLQTALVRSADGGKADVISRITGRPLISENCLRKVVK